MVRKKQHRLFRKLVSWFGIVIFSVQIALGQYEQESAFAVLTLNFVRFTNWPDQSMTEMNICVYGNNIVQESFALIDNKIANKKTVNIVLLSRLKNLDQCQTLYISELNKYTLDQLFLEIKNLPILTVSGQEDFVKAGGMVEIRNVEGKIRFFINLKHVERAGLKMSSRLLKLAQIIEDS